ncbi:LysR family transcriptional regulator [Nocardia amikacinitolerans]|uniref:LysR family transcriptional regulator n=1 Tax=Nocardia amikacinitolerans TaxID=756689 RepID=UPI0012ED39AA|nr:LysR family transcriptional regulator [Nocardia amikacinitolerans]
MTTPRPDMNLLVALHALLEERHVSRAAERIGVSQPAASALLARLRRKFGDELLVRVGNGYELTPLAVQLSEQVAGVMQLSDRLFATKSHFDPSTTEREFALVISDYAVAVLGPALLSAFETQAPHAVLRFRQFGFAVPSDTEMRSVDGLIAPRGTLPAGLHGIELFADEWVAIVDRRNEHVGETLDWRRLDDLRWVFGQHDRRQMPLVMRRLAERGVQIQPHAVIDSFLALPRYVRGTDRVGVVQRRLTRDLAWPPELRVLPFDAGPINDALWWHPIHAHDSGHRWFRELVGDVGRLLDADTAVE